MGVEIRNVINNLFVCFWSITDLGIQMNNFLSIHNTFIVSLITNTGKTHMIYLFISEIRKKHQHTFCWKIALFRALFLISPVILWENEYTWHFILANYKHQKFIIH